MVSVEYSHCNGQTERHTKSNDTILQFDLVKELIRPTEAIKLDGSSLSIGDVVSGGRHYASVAIEQSEQVVGRIDTSVRFLQSKLGTSIYGVTTGFGGSAETRTEKVNALQISLLEHQAAGILPVNVTFGGDNMMPEEVVRGAMIIRVNSLTRGHSAVRLSVLNTIVKFLECGITPVVPLRGSISASGDLSPLSYIASALMGHDDIRVMVRKGDHVEIMTSREALDKFNIPPVVLGAKEGLGLINGTAVSAAMAAIALHEAHFLTLLSQACTALTVEAMIGHTGSFDPFIHDVTRPHPGQIQVAKNIRTMLSGSTFAIHHEAELSVREDEGVLRQDRYPLRTAAQWLGPMVSDLIGSHAQLTIELNSTTDNPLIDVAGDKIHHGGNFQAMSITNAMEKTRLGLQQVGKLSYTQLTELVNCSMSRGLPSCLAAEDPSTNYHVKGCDIAIASYTSELGFLANPVVTHVQNAEMSNQAVNSLALISARKTREANDVLAMLLSTHLYCVCQALDLRYLEFAFRDQFNRTILPSLVASFSPYLASEDLVPLASQVISTMWRRLETTSSMDLEDRFQDAFKFCSSLLIDAFDVALPTNGNPVHALADWRRSLALSAVTLTRSIRNEFFANSASATAPSSTLQYLGRSAPLYRFVRETLGVKARRGDVYMGTREKTIGSNISTIYEAVKDGRINPILIQIMS